MNRFKDLLTQSSHHGLEGWNLCQIAYKGLDESTKTTIKYICGESFFETMLISVGTFLKIQLITCMSGRQLGKLLVLHGMLIWIRACYVMNIVAL